MFNRRKKLDPRVRFQNLNFTRRLQQAKRYQRSTRPVPETLIGRAMTAIGLDSLWSRLAVAACLLGLIYLTYIPNFLFIKNIDVTGMTDDGATSVRQTVQEFFASSRVPWPQQNTIFFRPARLASYLTAHNSQVWKVAGIDKKLFNRIVVRVNPKQERYAIGTPTGALVAFNDGTVARPLDLGAATFSEAALPGLIKFKLGPIAPPAVGAKVFSPALVQALEQLIDGFGSQLQLSITYITPFDSGPTEAIAQLPLDPHELSVYTRKKSGSGDFRIIFDTRNDLGPVINQLKLLLGTFTPERLASLAYIDLRLPDRAYVCLVRTPCDSTPSPPINPAPIINPTPNAP